MRIRIVRRPLVTSIDGICLDHFIVGQEYEVGVVLASVLVAEGWAEPIISNIPKSAEPFSTDDPYDSRVIDANQKLVRHQSLGGTPHRRGTAAHRPKRTRR
jgi:hypothetical protein